jgi:hypothetical protein
MFTAVAVPEEKPKEQQAVKLQYEPSECYTIGEVSEKYNVSLSTVSNIIRRNSIPKREIGKFVYVLKDMIDKLLARKYYERISKNQINSPFAQSRRP